MLRLRFYGEKLNFSLSLSHLFSYLRPRICFTFTTVFEIFLILLCFAAKPTTWTENKNTNTKWAPGRAPPPSPPPPRRGASPPRSPRKPRPREWPCPRRRWRPRRRGHPAGRGTTGEPSLGTPRAPSGLSSLTDPREGTEMTAAHPLLPARTSLPPEGATTAAGERRRRRRPTLHPLTL